MQEVPGEIVVSPGWRLEVSPSSEHFASGEVAPHFTMERIEVTDQPPVHPDDAALKRLRAFASGEGRLLAYTSTVREDVKWLLSLVQDAPSDANPCADIPEPEQAHVCPGCKQQARYHRDSDGLCASCAHWADKQWVEHGAVVQRTPTGDLVYGCSCGDTFVDANVQHGHVKAMRAVPRPASLLHPNLDDPLVQAAMTKPLDGIARLGAPVLVHDGVTGEPYIGTEADRERENERYRHPDQPKQREEWLAQRARCGSEGTWVGQTPATSFRIPCTLPVEHTGDHIARDEDGRTLAWWVNADDPAVGPKMPQPERATNPKPWRLLKATEGRHKGVAYICDMSTETGQAHYNGLLDGLGRGGSTCTSMDYATYEEALAANGTTQRIWGSGADPKIDRALALLERMGLEWNQMTSRWFPKRPEEVVVLHNDVVYERHGMWGSAVLKAARDEDGTVRRGENRGTEVLVSEREWDRAQAAAEHLESVGGWQWRHRGGEWKWTHLVDDLTLTTPSGEPLVEDPNGAFYVDRRPGATPRPEQIEQALKEQRKARQKAARARKDRPSPVDTMEVASSPVEADYGHTWRITAYSRMSSMVDGDAHHSDAKEFSTVGFQTGVRAWSLSQALKRARKVPLAEWTEVEQAEPGQPGGDRCSGYLWDGTECLEQHDGFGYHKSSLSLLSNAHVTSAEAGHCVTLVVGGPDGGVLASIRCKRHEHLPPHSSTVDDQMPIVSVEELVAMGGLEPTRGAVEALEPDPIEIPPLPPEEPVQAPQPVWEHYTPNAVTQAHCIVRGCGVTGRNAVGFRERFTPEGDPRSFTGLLCSTHWAVLFPHLDDLSAIGAKIDMPWIELGP